MKLSSLFSQRPPTTTPRPSAPRRDAERPAPAPKPVRKRSLNEAAHKVAR